MSLVGRVLRYDHVPVAIRIAHMAKEEFCQRAMVLVRDELEAGRARKAASLGGGADFNSVSRVLIKVHGTSRCTCIIYSCDYMVHHRMADSMTRHDQVSTKKHCANVSYLADQGLAGQIVPKKCHGDARSRPSEFCTVL